MKVIMISFIFLFSLGYSLDSRAQFKKYKSRAKYNATTPTPQKPSATINSPSLQDSDSNKAYFGNRETKTEDNKDSKYVNLNLETAFGPEIVTSFDFPDTDIMELTKHMQKLTGINLIVDKDVKGKVSITAPTPITVGDAWKAYLSALNMAGYTLVQSGAFYKIINARDVRYVPTKIYTGGYTPNTEAQMMKIIALKNVSASEISRNFRPFMSRYGRIIDIKQTNTIIISDTGANINRLETLIKFLDVPGHDVTLQIIPVKNSSAQEIAKLLDEILNSNSTSSRSTRRSKSSRFSPTSSSSGGSGGSTISKIIAEQRTNSIIAMANAEGARQLRELIKKLDVKLLATSSGRIHVHYLNYGNSEELAKTLSTLVGNAKSTSSKSKTSRFTSRGVETKNIFNDEVKVTADKNNNALVVTASPTDWLTLQNVIAKLDIPRDQVYVKGMIMETSINKIRGFGVEFMGAYGDGNVQRAGFTQSGSGFTDLLTTGNPLNLSGFFAGIGGPEKSAKTFTIGGQSIKINSVNGLIKAIATNSNTNILATPQVLAMDNTEAEFEVGNTIPIQKTTQSSSGTSTTSYENQQATLKLKLTPQINKVTRFVKLKISYNIDDFTGDYDASGSGAATVTRSVNTEIMVRDGDTIAMGGLLRDKETVAFSKVPLLGDIPVLGWLFKNKQKTLEKVNLLFFLTPNILSPYETTVAKHNLKLLKERKDNLKNIVDEDNEEPFKEEVAVINEKMQRQIDGPIYDQTNPNIYKENNKNTEGIGSPTLNGEVNEE